MRESKKCRRSPWRPSYAMLHSTTFKRGTAYIGIVAGVLGLLFLPTFLNRLHDLWDIQPRRVRLPGDLEVLSGAHTVQARVTSRRTHSPPPRWHRSFHECWGRLRRRTRQDEG